MESVPVRVEELEVSCCNLCFLEYCMARPRYICITDINYTVTLYLPMLSGSTSIPCFTFLKFVESIFISGGDESCDVHMANHTMR